MGCQAGSGCDSGVLGSGLLESHEQIGRSKAKKRVRTERRSRIVCPPFRGLGKGEETAENHPKREEGNYGTSEAKDELQVGGWPACWSLQMGRVARLG